MSVGKPVITSAVSSLPEVGGDVAYYIHDVYDSDELCNQMIKVTSLSTSEKETLSKRSKNRARLFSRKKCAEQLLELIKKV